MLGDLPLVGRLFQSQSKTSVKKNLMIFVTATIVDPAGNRVHSDDELPFAQSTIPPQQPGMEVRPGNRPVQPANDRSSAPAMKSPKAKPTIVEELRTFEPPEAGRWRPANLWIGC